MIHDGLWDAYNDFHMGMTAELVAEKYKITREEQDRSRSKATRRPFAPCKSCFFESQIVPVEVPQKKGAPIVIRKDESPRADSSLEDARRSCKPAFKKDGTVTAGNAPGTNDGAAAVVVTSERNAARLGKDADGAHRRAGRQRRRAEVGDDGAGAGRRNTAEENRLGPRSRRRSDSNSTKPSPCRRSP